MYRFVIDHRGVVVSKRKQLYDLLTCMIHALHPSF